MTYNTEDDSIFEFDPEEFTGDEIVSDEHKPNADKLAQSSSFDDPFADEEHLISAMFSKPSPAPKVNHEVNEPSGAEISNALEAADSEPSPEVSNNTIQQKGHHKPDDVTAKDDNQANTVTAEDVSIPANHNANNLSAHSSTESDDVPNRDKASKASSKKKNELDDEVIGAKQNHSSIPQEEVESILTPSKPKTIRPTVNADAISENTETNGMAPLKVNQAYIQQYRGQKHVSTTVQVFENKSLKNLRQGNEVEYEIDIDAGKTTYTVSLFNANPFGPNQKFTATESGSHLEFEGANNKAQAELMVKYAAEYGWKDLAVWGNQEFVNEVKRLAIKQDINVIRVPKKLDALDVRKSPCSADDDLPLTTKLSPRVKPIKKTLAASQMSSESDQENVAKSGLSENESAAQKNMESARATNSDAEVNVRNEHKNLSGLTAASMPVIKPAATNKPKRSIENQTFEDEPANSMVKSM